MPSVNRKNKICAEYILDDILEAGGKSLIENAALRVYARLLYGKAPKGDTLPDLDS